MFAPLKRLVHSVSALDVRFERLGWDVRYVPIADIAASFDHLVGVGKQRRRHFKAERSRSLKVDH